MARVLLVGCGGRGQALSRRLVTGGHAVAGTTRDPRRIAAIEAAGARGHVCDPDRIGTLMGALEGVGVVAWLLGSASGPARRVADLHDGRLRMLLEKVVDTPVRGVLYETGGSVPRAVTDRGRDVLARAHGTWRIPVAVLEAGPADRAAWLAEAEAAVAELLSPVAVARLR